jgi:hypothetical protein
LAAAVYASKAAPVSPSGNAPMTAAKRVEGFRLRVLGGVRYENRAGLALRKGADHCSQRVWRLRFRV